MKILSYIFILLLVVSTALAQNKGKVRLHGQLVDMGSAEVTMAYDGASSYLGDSRDILLHTDSEGRFDTTIVVEKPCFYSICRNTMYLSPGDNLEVYITTDNREAEFKGCGAEANNYMKYRLFPKGGSFLEAGSNIGKDLNATKVLIDSLAQARQAQLDALVNVSDDFRQLESARIKGDYVNSFFFYPSYANMFSGKKSREEMVKAHDEFMTSILPIVKPVIKEIADGRFLDVNVVRGVMLEVASMDDKSWTEGITLSSRTLELKKCASVVSQLRREATPDVVAKAQAFLLTVKNSDFAAELKGKVAQSSKLLPGQEAFDFVMTDPEGKEKHLSDFKGRPIFLDFWATWCGPCIQESPYFDELSKAYPEVQFIAMSTDTNRKAWLNYLGAHKKNAPQFNTVDNAIREQWGIFYIPRFVVIDKHFKIVDAYAPVPSSNEAIRKILDTLQ